MNYAVHGLTEDQILKIKEFGSKNEHIISIIAYGSRVRSNYRDDSDLDLAFEIDKAANDSNAFATWIFEKQRWEKDLAKIINLKLHLELLDNDTPTVQAGVKSGSVVLYARKTTKGSKRFTPT